MHVHITFDVEIWCQGWLNLDENFPAAYRRYVYGPPPKETGALPSNLNILQQHGLKAVFFVEPLFALRFGIEPLAELIQLIRSYDQDVQMHLHPEWLDELPTPLVAPRKKTQHIHQFTLDEQTAILSAGADILQQAGAPRPTAFRGGNFSMNADTLTALSSLGFTVDSSLNAFFDFTYPDSATCPRQTCSRQGAITEFPVTLFKDGFGRLRPLHITACSAAEMEQSIASARDQGQPAVTLVSHNFELLTPGLLKEDRIAVRRFDRLCSWLARHQDEFQVGSYQADLAAEHSKEPEFPTVSPTATAARYVEQLQRKFQ